MGFFDYVAAGNQALGGYFQGQNQGREDAFRRQMAEREQKRLEDALAMQKYAQEQETLRAQQSDLADAPLREAQTHYYEALAGKAGRYGSGNGSGGKSFRQIQAEKKSQNAESAEEEEGNVILNQIAPGDIQHGAPNDVQRAFGDAFRSVREMHPDWKPGRVAYRAHKYLSKTRPDLRPRLDGDTGKTVTGSYGGAPQPADSGGVPGIRNNAYGEPDEGVSAQPRAPQQSFLGRAVSGIKHAYQNAEAGVAEHTRQMNTPGGDNYDLQGNPRTGPLPSRMGDMAHDYDTMAGQVGDSAATAQIGPRSGGPPQPPMPPSVGEDPYQQRARQKNAPGGFDRDRSGNMRSGPYPAIQEDARRDWDMLAREYGVEETTRQVGPRP